MRCIALRCCTAPQGTATQRTASDVNEPLGCRRMRGNRCICVVARCCGACREFFYIQMEKYSRQALAEGVKNVSDLVVSTDCELFRVLVLHYNRNNQIEVRSLARSLAICHHPPTTLSHRTSSSSSSSTF